GDKLTMIDRVNATVLFVQNLEKMMVFYRDTLGLEVVFSDEVSFAFRMVEQDFALVTVSEGAKMLSNEVFASRQASNSHVMLCVDIDNIDDVYQVLKSKGVTFIKPPVDQHWGYRTAYFADPEGNIWEFRQSI
ncbi:MAG: VOC family protein, partial [Aggregatilineales bacterium]